MSEKTNDRVDSIKITDKENNAVYELDFCRESIRFAEQRQFKLEDVYDYPETKFPELFFYAFRMHHKNLARTQTDALYKRLGGFSRGMLERLGLLYNQAALSNNVVENDEDMGKNGNLTVEF